MTPVPKSPARRAPTASRKAAARVSAADWTRIAADLEARGAATTGPLLTPAECRALTALYAAETGYRKRVIMARHGYGQGEYKYFAYPLPPLVAELRKALYPRLAPIALRWYAAMGRKADLPDTLAGYLARCHAAGQTRPTPLLLRYGAGDYNCLHQDLYGAQVFPLQLTILLSRPDHDFTGGEFVLPNQ